MPHRLVKFLKVLDAECEDLRDDIEDIIVRMQEKLAQKKITEHVYFANVALLRGELLMVDMLRRLIAEIETKDYQSIHALSNAIREEAHRHIDRDGHSPCLKAMLDRKLNKVKRYVLEPEG